MPMVACLGTTFLLSAGGVHILHYFDERIFYPKVFRCQVHDRKDLWVLKEVLALEVVRVAVLQPPVVRHHRTDDLLRGHRAVVLFDVPDLLRQLPPVKTGGLQLESSEMLLLP